MSVVLTTPEDLRWWLDLAPTLPWKRALTMPHAPHSYVVRDRMLDSADFLRAVRVIRTFGEPGKFYARTNIYLTDPTTNQKWWTMGAPLAETTIINQAEAGVVYGEQDAPHTATGHVTIYDELATVYDARYDTPECLQENLAVRSVITRALGAYAPHVLDIGCGTGLALDLGLTHPSLYVGVDPSQGMLNELVRKHPRATRLMPAPFEEVLDSFEPRQFDAVLSLFGSPSYICPEAIEAIPRLSRQLVVLMHYEDGYLPDYERGLMDPSEHASSREAARSLLDRHAGREFALGRFNVVVLDRL